MRVLSAPASGIKCPIAHFIEKKLYKIMMIPFSLTAEVPDKDQYLQLYYPQQKEKRLISRRKKFKLNESSGIKRRRVKIIILASNSIFEPKNV